MASAGGWRRAFAVFGRGALEHGKFSLRVAAAAGSLGSAGAAPRCHEASEGGHTQRSFSSMPKNQSHVHLRDEDRSARLVFGVPNKGQLHQEVKTLLHGAGLEYACHDRLDIAHCTNLPVSIVFLPSAEIASYVRAGDIDLGITGEDVVAESKRDRKIVLPLEAGMSTSISFPDVNEHMFLIANPHSQHRQLIEVLRRRIAGHLAENTWVMVTYNVEKAKLHLAEKITPGKRSPSIVPLEDSNWVAVTAAVMKMYSPGIMDQLQFVGAQDIILTE